MALLYNGNLLTLVVSFFFCMFSSSLKGTSHGSLYLSSETLKSRNDPLASLYITTRVSCGVVKTSR